MHEARKDAGDDETGILTVMRVFPSVNLGIWLFIPVFIDNEPVYVNVSV